MMPLIQKAAKIRTITYRLCRFVKQKPISKSLLNVPQVLRMAPVFGGGAFSGFEENNAAKVGDYGIVNKARHKVFDDYVVNGGLRPVIHITVK